MIWLAWMDEEPYDMAQSPSDRIQQTALLSALIVAVALAVALPVSHVVHNLSGHNRPISRPLWLIC